MRRVLGFMAQALAAGIIAALIVVALLPGTAQPERSLVTVERQVPAAEPAAAASGFRDAVARAVPSVVSVSTRRAPPAGAGAQGNPLYRYFFGDDPEVETPVSGLGSGVIVSTQGYVLTNNHVVDGAEEIVVTLADGSAVPAERVGSDPETDLAVLRIAARGLTPITLNRAAAVAVGDAVLAVGNPFGVGITVTQGIVSATGRTRLGINTFENFIQTDAAINPGNSGGALIDASGALVGINTAIYSRSGGSEGIGFAIPVDLAGQVMEQIIATGRVERGWIGVSARDVAHAPPPAPQPEALGPIVVGVLRGGPAYRGGLRPGDMVLAIDGKPVHDTYALITETAAVKPGTPARFTVRRERERLDLSVQVGTRPPASAS